MESKFTKCPACDSTNRFFEGLGKELVQKGFARPEFNMCLDAKQGVVVDQTKIASVPIGSEVPGYAIKTDICTDCGCIYAIELHSEPVKKTLRPVQVMPNRNQRRHPEIFGLNNPRLS